MYHMWCVPAATAAGAPAITLDEQKENEMGTLQTAAAAQIAAPPDDIYAVLSDYHDGHPHILPPQYFPSLTVEQGGQGAGTIFRVCTRALGQERTYRMQVEEPEPGRVLVEHDPDAGVVTTFTITPLEDGSGSQVQIATEWHTPDGLAGLVERLVTPPIMRHIFRTELRQLAAYLAARQ
jgi:hypothetical protein